MSPFLGTRSLWMRQTVLSVRMLALPQHPVFRVTIAYPQNTYTPVPQHPHVAAQVPLWSTPVTVTEPSSAPTQRAPWAKNKILETANELFYGDGIRTVGVDRLISESAVTKATFYKHYGSKDRLIVQYVKFRDKATRDRVHTVIDGNPTPEVALRGLMTQVSDEIAAPDFRGCAFLNAASEYPDPNHPVRLVVAEHRDWYTGVLTEQLAAMGHPMPGDAADELMLACDGARGGGYAGDPIAATTALSRVVDRVLSEAKK